MRRCASSKWNRLPSTLHEGGASRLWGGNESREEKRTGSHQLNGSPPPVSRPPAPPCPVLTMTASISASSRSIVGVFQNRSGSSCRSSATAPPAPLLALAPPPALAPPTPTVASPAPLPVAGLASLLPLLPPGEPCSPVPRGTSRARWKGWSLSGLKCGPEERISWKCENCEAISWGAAGCGWGSCCSGGGEGRGASGEERGQEGQCQ